MCISVARFALYISVVRSRMGSKTKFCPNATGGSAEPAIGSHLTYRTDPQGNRNGTVAQERLQIPKQKYLIASNWSRRLASTAQQQGTIQALYLSDSTISNNDAMSWVAPNFDWAAPIGESEYCLNFRSEFSSLCFRTLFLCSIQLLYWTLFTVGV